MRKTYVLATFQGEIIQRLGIHNEQEGLFPTSWFQCYHRRFRNHKRTSLYSCGYQAFNTRVGFQLNFHLFIIHCYYVLDIY